MNAEGQVREIIYGYSQQCDLCGHDFPIHKYDPFFEINNDNYVECVGKQFLCKNCRKE